jgi:hypothetical protein
MEFWGSGLEFFDCSCAGGFIIVCMDGVFGIHADVGSISDAILCHGKILLVRSGWMGLHSETKNSGDAGSVICAAAIVPPLRRQ